MAAEARAAVRVIGRTPYCPSCGLRMLAREDHYYCVLCGREWVPGPDWVGDVWADEMRYKYSIALLKGGSRKAGRKRRTPSMEKLLRWARREQRERGYGY
jgi:hypothetical protein